MNPEETYVSVVEPVSPAIERVKTVLFRPFDLGRWFVIGFGAWLAGMGNPAGGGGNGAGEGAPSVPPGMAFEDIPDQFRHGYEDAQTFIREDPLAVLAGVLVLGLVVGFSLLITWLSSRGRFIFLHCVAQNKAEVTNPWHEFRRQANSLFAFRIVMGILWFLAAAAFVVPVVVMLYFSKVKLDSTPLTIAGVVAFAVSLLAVMIVFGIIGSFTTDFVVPIMYQRRMTCRQAWAVLLDLLGVNKIRFFLYVLFQFVIGIAIRTILIAIACLTCCVACCLFFIPYVGTVARLPFIMFRRAYSLHYLAQYGSDFNVFAQESAEPQPM
ncbi:MAG: hypothetical protein JW993_12260 [Sedimentisphaerales bacterium]|nr:hypothetical protein [Sedimentisphaerales bacterium]